MHFFFLFLILSLAGAGCKVIQDAPPGGSKGPDAAELIRTLQATTENWNKGDLDGFIAPYDSSSAFMTKSGPVGRVDMRARYANAYFALKEPRQTLQFEQIAVRPLGQDHALMTGRFILSGGGAPEQTGWFSLVWGRTEHGWKILHDHSS